MHKIVVSRKHGTQKIETLVRVDCEGSPSIEMDLEDFMVILLQSVPNMKADFKSVVGSVTTVFTKANADKRIDEAFDKVNIEQRIVNAFNEVVRRMKEDSAHLAKHIK